MRIDSMKELIEKNLRINETLRLFRIAYDLSVKELSEMTGLTTVYIHEIERGVKKPSLETIQRYGSALGINPAVIMYFIHDEENDRDETQKLLLSILTFIVNPDKKGFLNS